MRPVSITPHLNACQASAIASMLGRRNVPYGYRHGITRMVHAVGARSHKHLAPICEACDAIERALEGGRGTRARLTFTTGQIRVVERAYLWVVAEDLADSSMVNDGIANGSTAHLRDAQFHSRYGLTPQHANLLRRSLSLESEIALRIASQPQVVNLPLQEALESAQEMRAEWTEHYRPTTAIERNPVIRLLRDTLAFAWDQLSIEEFGAGQRQVVDAHELDVDAALINDSLRR